MIILFLEKCRYAEYVYVFFCLLLSNIALLDYVICLLNILSSLCFSITVSVHDTSDDIVGISDDSNCIKIPTEELIVGSWVGVKIKKSYVFSKGRARKPFKVYV